MDPAQELNRHNQERHDFRIIVNAREKQVDHPELTFDEVVHLAFPEPPGNDVVYTVSYSNAVKPRHSGTLVQGEVVTIKDGTIFNVTKTNKS